MPENERTAPHGAASSSSAGRMDGKVAVITGGASGIGRTCALRFSQEGASVVVADLKPDRAEAVAAEITNRGRPATWTQVDTSDPDQIEAMAAAAVAAFGRLGEAADIANACLYLCSDEASFVTGEIIAPDGGLAADVR